jgi:RNA polymerase sigma-70 factor (ECF subfamily)
MPDPNRIDGFVALFTSHELRLRAYAMSLIPNQADAEDVLQQANLLLWKKFDTFQSGTNFMAWAVRVVHHEAQRHRRRQVRDKLRFGDDFFEAVSVAAASREAADAMAEQELLLADCIAKLRPEHRDILRARYSEGWTVERMAATFHRSAEAIWNVLSRIRRALQTCVTEANRQRT